MLATRFLLLDETGRFERLISLLFAAIQRNTDALVDDFAVLNENGVLLRRPVRVYPETSGPNGSLEVVGSPYSGNFERP